MNYKIVVAAYNCGDLIERCLKSIEVQNHPNFDVCIVDDASDDVRMRHVISEYAERNGWTAFFNEENMGALYNHCMAIDAICSDPEDVIVFVDGDDALAHNRVLKRLDSYYDKDVDLTYGQYRSVPYSATCSLAQPFPNSVIADNSYRQFARSKHGGLLTNHLRTFKYKLYQRMDPEIDFKNRFGYWYQTCTDTAMMIPALEIAGPGKHRFIREVLYLYTSDNPISDWRVNLKYIDENHKDILHRNPPKPCMYEEIE